MNTNKFFIPLFFLAILTLPAISTAQSQGNYYSPVKPQKHPGDCEQGEDCQSSRRYMRPARLTVHQHNFNLNLYNNYPDRKSPWLAFGLEFFVGWGTGHFYAGNYGWGLYGLSGLGALIFGITQIANHGNEGMAITLVLYGAISRIVNLVSAPLVTHNDNQRKRQKYLMKMNKNRYNPQDRNYRHFGKLQQQWQPENPFTRIPAGSRIMLPIFNTTF